MSQQPTSVVEKTLASLQEQAAPPVPAPASSPPLTAEMLVAVMSAAMTAAVAPLMARLDRIEGGRPAALPASAPQKSDRALVVELVDEHCHRTRERHRDVWKWLYRQYQRYGHGDIYVQAGRNHREKIAEIEHAGKMATFLQIVRQELPKKPIGAAPEPSASTGTAPAQGQAPTGVFQEALAAKGMTLADLALGTGLASSTLSKYARGHVPGRRARDKIATALSRSARELWGAQPPAPVPCFTVPLVTRRCVGSEPEPTR